MKQSQVAHNSDLARRGNAALDLVHQVAEIVASRESQHEADLQTILKRLKAADDRSSVLTQRAAEAEKRAVEAERWLRRLYTKLEEEFASVRQNVAAA